MAFAVVRWWWRIVLIQKYTLVSNFAALTHARQQTCFSVGLCYKF
jgi:hypothetical protein